jgi:hypothetical protein
MLRRLSLISVRDALATRGHDNGVAATVGAAPPATLSPNENLRDALSHLLRAGAESLPVVGPNGEQLGELSFEDLRALSASTEAVTS